MGSHDGILSLWKIPAQMKQLMLNVLSQLEQNENYWEQFEIKYNIKNENQNDFPRKYRTEITRKNEMVNSEEFEDDGPHKGIQTWTKDINYNNIKNKSNSFNNGINTDDNNINIINNNKDNYRKNTNITDYKTSSYIPSNINNNNKNDDINISNINSNNNKSKNTKRKKENDLDKNLKEETTLQNCYEKFKKERLMKNSFIKPNIINNKTNKNNLTKTKKGNNTKSLSSRKIAYNKNTKYLKQPIYNNNIYNKKENDTIDFEIDVDINKIRPNFDPNLYSDHINQKYSSISKELIKPYLTNKNNIDYLRHNSNDFEKLSYQNNNEFKNFSSSNNNNINSSKNIMNKSKTTRAKQEEKI